MDPLTAHHWAAAQLPDYFRATRIRDAWDEWHDHGEPSTIAAFRVALRCVQAVPDPDAPHAIAAEVNLPPELIETAADPVARLEAAEATISALNGPLAEAQMGVADPLIEEQLDTLALTHGPDGILMLSWWAWSALEYVRAKQPHRFAAAVARIEAELTAG